jgi:hypothetical protein
VTAFAAAASAHPLRIGQVITGTARELQRNGPILLVFAAVFVALPDFGLSYMEHLLQPPRLETFVYLTLLAGDRVVALASESWLFAAAFRLATHPGIVGPGAWLDALGFAARRFAPVFVARLAGVALLIALPLGTLEAIVSAARAGGGSPPTLATGLLILAAVTFPGAVTLVCWSLAPAIVAVEGRGPIAALTRSWRLTTGSRLQIAAALLLYLAAVGVLSIAVLLAVFLGRAVIKDWLVLTVWGVGTALLASVLAAVGLISVWRELAGPPPDAVAAMFD